MQIKKNQLAAPAQIAITLLKHVRFQNFWHNISSGPRNNARHVWQIDNEMKNRPNVALFTGVCHNRCNCLPERCRRVDTIPDKTATSFRTRWAEECGPASILITHIPGMVWKWTERNGGVHKIALPLVYGASCPIWRSWWVWWSYGYEENATDVIRLHVSKYCITPSLLYQLNTYYVEKVNDAIKMCYTNRWWAILVQDLNESNVPFGVGSIKNITFQIYH